MRNFRDRKRLHLGVIWGLMVFIITLFFMSTMAFAQRRPTGYPHTTDTPFSMFTGIRLPQTVFYDSVFPEVDCQYTLGSPAYRWILHACYIYAGSGLNMQKANIDSVDTIFVDVVTFDSPEYILFLADTLEFQADEVFNVQANKVIFGNLAQNYAGGSYSFCGGDRDSAIGGWSVVNGGAYNTARAAYSVVGGGTFHDAAGGFSVISGGSHGTITSAGVYSGIGWGIWDSVTAKYGFAGGYNCDAKGDSGSIALGYNCRATDIFCTVSGGLQNVTNGEGATVAGGAENYAAGDYSVVGGGRYDTASGEHYATVGGGYHNKASAICATVSGGDDNTASGHSSTVGGGVYSMASGNTSFVGGGESNTASGVGAAIPGGDANYAAGDYSVVGGGQYDTASGEYSIVGGGLQNVASGDASSIVGGTENIASNFCASLVGGESNESTGEHAFVGGGKDNNASATYATISGGMGNNVSGVTALVAGGYNNYAVGEFSGIGWGTSDSVHTKGSYAGGGYCEVWGAPDDSFSIALGYGSIADSVFNSVALNGVREDAYLTTGTHNSNVHYALSTQREDTALANGSNNDITVGGRSFVKITGPTGAFTISGVANGFDGKRIVIYNSVAQNMTISNEDANSAAANRITTMTGGDLVSTAVATVELIYDADASRWVVIGWRP